MNADIEWMVLTNNRFAKDVEGDRHIQSFDQGRGSSYGQIGPLRRLPKSPDVLADSNMVRTSARGFAQGSPVVSSSTVLVLWEVYANGTCTMSRGISR